MQPIIGITRPERGDFAVHMALITAVKIAGGEPLALSTGMSWREAELDGLLIGGGDDVFPQHYGQEAIEGARYDQDRDEMEMYWARKARDTKIPTLAICRGAQVMNVASGGTLHQRLDNIYEDVDYPSTFMGQIFYRKRISITARSLLKSLIGRASVKVNSIHKQAIAEPGEGLEITAQEKNGVVQAIEDPDRAFYLGVQFHPEFLIHQKKFRNIFKGLVSASRIYRQKRFLEQQ